MDNRTKSSCSRFLNFLLGNVKIANIFVLDREGIILDINEAVTRTFGYYSEDLKGRYFSLLFTPEDLAKKKPETELSTVLKKGEALDHNYIVAKDGSYIWVHGESSYTEDPEGNVFIIKLVYDLSKEKRLESRLTQVNEKLLENQEESFKVNKELIRVNESLNRIVHDLDNFVYTASHDLKAPIADIEALINTLYEELNEESRRHTEELVQMLNQSVQTFKNTIADLAFIGKAQQEDGTSEVHLESLLEEVELNLREEISTSNAMLSKNFNTASSIHFSRKNLRSILQNLISNAIKYRSPERKPEIRISSQQDGEYVLLSVSDNGLGIREEDKPKVYGMYKRLHYHVEGSGIGLTLVARIVDRSGGRIEIDSKEGVGTTFKVYLKTQN